MLKIFCVTVLLLGSLAAAQQQDILGLTDFPAPAWPEDGAVPPELKDQYVFLDLPRNEYVVAYPENLGTTKFAEDPGNLKVTRYELLRNVAPAVTVSIEGGKYTYTIANGPTAGQSIDQFVLVIPKTAARAEIRQPAGWFGIIQNDRNFKLKSSEWIPNGAAAIWSFHQPGQIILPGTSQTGFELQSDLRPGFAVGFARRSHATDVKVTTQGNVPKEVMAQLAPILAIEYNSKTLLTLAPKFDSAADDHTIASDFIQGIISLTRAGVLEFNSEFGRNTMNELTRIPPGARGTSIKLGAPRTPAETELAGALKAALP